MVHQLHFDFKWCFKVQENMEVFEKVRRLAFNFLKLGIFKRNAEGICNSHSNIHSFI